MVAFYDAGVFGPFGGLLYLVYLFGMGLTAVEKLKEILEDIENEELFDIVPHTDQEAYLQGTLQRLVDACRAYIESENEWSTRD